MKNTLLYLSLLIFITSFVSAQQTMSFPSGPNHSGFSFSGWNGSGGTIWHSNLSSPASCSKNSGTWDFVSFKVGPYTGSNTYRVTSNLGHTYDYSGNTTQVHTLNWTGITSISFSRIAGSGLASDHDDFVFNETVLNLTSFEQSDKPQVYPNPAKDNLSISFTKEFELINIELYDLKGQLIKSVNSSDLELNDVAAGFYLLKINMENDVSWSKKIIKL